MSNVSNEGVLRPGPGATGHSGAAGHAGSTEQSSSSGAQAAKQRSQAELDAARGAASEAVDSVKAQASELRHAVSQEANKVGSDVRRSANEAAQRLRSEGLAMISRQKNAAAEELSHLRDALNAASDKLDDHDDRRIADLAHVAADRLDAVAGYLRQQDLRHLASDLSASARRRPAMFYGGLFAVGLAASRFLKASSHHGDARG